MYPGREREKCARRGRVQASSVESGKLRQQLICFNSRVNQGGLLALAQGNGGAMFPFPLEQEQFLGSRDALKPALPSACTGQRPFQAPPPHPTPPPATWLSPSVAPTSLHLQQHLRVSPSFPGTSERSAHYPGSSSNYLYGKLSLTGLYTP